MAKLVSTSSYIADDTQRLCASNNFSPNGFSNLSLVRRRDAVLGTSSLLRLLDHRSQNGMTANNTIVQALPNNNGLSVIRSPINRENTK